MSDPTYPAEIKFSHIAMVYKKILLEKEYHKEHSLFYYQLFNEQVHCRITERSLDKVTLVYTPLQEFYQKQAQYHAAKHFSIDRKIIEFEEVINKMLLE